MPLRFAVLGILVLALVGVAPAGASAPSVTGTTNCAFGGALFLDHLPLSSPGPAADKETHHIRSSTGASGCVTEANLAFDVIIVKLQGTTVTPAHTPRLSCLGLADNPATSYKATLQFRRDSPKGKVVATSKATLTTSAVSLGTPVAFELSGAISTGAFKSEHIAIHMAFNQQWPYIVVDCSDENGLNNLDMTGIFASTLSIAP